MNVTRKLSQLILASAVIGGLVLATVPAALADGGLRNCVDLTGREVDRVGCWEDIWAGGEEYRMTFGNTSYTGGTASDVDAFYVLAPQGSVAQGALPFPHDHVIRELPQHNGGAYTAKFRAYFVMCSEQGIVSGACEPTMSTIEGVGTLPLAHQVNGGPLTSTASIEAALDAGQVALFDTGAVIVGTVTAAR